MCEEEGRNVSNESMCVSNQSTCVDMEQPEECSSEDVIEENVRETADVFETPQHRFSKEVQVNIAKCLK